MYVQQAIQGDVGTKILEDDGLWLKCMYVPVCTDEPCKGYRMSADICADFNYCVAWLDDLGKELNFVFSVFPVSGDSMSHVVVSWINHKYTMSAIDELIKSWQLVLAICR